MYTETRTTADEVLADVHTQLRAMANSVRADARTRRQHPTYINVAQVRAAVMRLRGAFQLSAHVCGGVDRLPLDLVQLITLAYNEAEEAVAK